MRILQLALVSTSLGFFSVGCATKTGTGALAGAGVGALAGGLIGGNATGALIGGAIGAVAGGLVGAALDAQDRQIMEKNSPNTLNKIDNRQQLSLYDIEAMSKNGLKDSVIIDQIKNTDSVFQLTTQEVIELKNAGVSQEVIDYMINTGKG